jgi:DNA-binding NarL/FixJ family response regulator
VIFLRETGNLGKSYVFPRETAKQFPTLTWEVGTVSQLKLAFCFGLLYNIIKKERIKHLQTKNNNNVGGYRMKLLNVKTAENTDSMVKNILKDESKSKSQKMKEMFKAGLEVKEIAELMNVRYNFVYNVTKNLIITESLQVEKVQKESKKDAVIKMHQEGKTNIQIATELKTNYNYIFKIVKEYKAEQQTEVK